jgi:sugar lactone lactonase YvrE
LFLAGGKTRVAAVGFDEIGAVAVSSDRWRLYIADKKRRYIFAMSICPDGKLKDKYIHAPLHLAEDCRTVGASELCVDAQDRVYAATELGIQGITSMGITDCILPLPGDLPAEKIAFGGPANDILYVQTGGGVFRRPWKVRGLREDDAPAAPSTPGYSD